MIIFNVKSQKNAGKVCIWCLLFAANFQDDEARTTAKIQEKQQE